MTKSIVVLGAGISGIGAAKLAKVKGFSVFVSDSGKISDKAKAVFDQYEIECEEALHMIRRGEIQDAKSIVGLFLASEWLKENEIECGQDDNGQT